MNDFPAEQDFSALKSLQDYCHAASRERGFYDLPDRMRALAHSLRESDPELAAYIEMTHLGNRLALVIGEGIEAHEEIRAGREPDETYLKYPPVPPSLAVEFPSGEDAREHWESTQPGKPEGVPSELADIMIRVFDLAGECGIDIGQAVAQKLAFNDTRARMHGGKKF